MKKIKFIVMFIILSILIDVTLPLISKANNIMTEDNIIKNEVIENDKNNIISNNVINEEKDNITTNEIINNNVTDKTTNDITKNEKSNQIINKNITTNEKVITDDNSKYLIEKQQTLSVKYSSHVQDFGWQNEVENGSTSGTTGKNKKIEAVKISLINNTSNIIIKYKTYVQSIGWQNDISNGAISGTTGRNLRMDAIKIWLENTNDYSVMYRTHIQDYGWQDWTYDGVISGSLGDDKKIEAIEIKIVPKVQNSEIAISYSSHVQDIGWESEKQQFDISGTTGKNKKIEALKLSLKNATNEINIKYTTYVEKSGWQSWVTNGKISGTTGRNLKVYGVRIKLEGTTNYSVEYRAHIQDYGWSNWKKNGDIVGNIAENKKIEAIQIKIVKETRSDSTSIGVEYYTYLHGFSDNENKIEINGETSGTTGENRKLEGLQIELKNAPKSAHIKYKAHVQDIGWMDYVQDGQIAGIIEHNLKVEAIQIKLEGMDSYTVEYKAHVQDIGWTNWYIDGETAGTTGQNKKIEAIQVRIVPKYKRYYKGVDVSYAQKEINYDKLVATGQVNFMIARIGWYSESRKVFNVDEQFKRNYKLIRQNNIPLGAYFYSYAESVDEAKTEAEQVVKYLKESGQTRYELPIFYDIEDKCQIALDKQTRTNMVISFCEILKNAGYKVGVYSYLYWLTNYMYLNQLPDDYSIWVAQYKGNDDGSLPDNIYKYLETHDIWQYTSKGKIDGINSEVCVDICYKKYFLN